MALPRNYCSNELGLIVSELIPDTSLRVSKTVAAGLSHFQLRRKEKLWKSNLPYKRCSAH